MERILQEILLSGLILFFTLATWALVEDWQAWAAVNHPEFQLRGNVYSPYNMSCAQMLSILEDPECSEYSDLRSQIRADFDTLSLYGYNLVRIYYHPKVDAVECTLLMPDSGEFCAMDTLLAMLDEAGLKLYVSLTGARDWAFEEGDTVPTCEREAVSDTSRYKAWLDSFLEAYGNHSTIVCWDLVTEGDPEDSVCNVWIEAILPYLQSKDTATVVTRGLGCGAAGAVGSLRGLGDFDVYDFHAYQKERSWVDSITGDTIITRRWTTLPATIDTVRLGSFEHTLQLGEFGFPVYKRKVGHVDQLTELEQRQLYRDFFYKLAELGISRANIFQMYDRLGGSRFGVYREGGSFKPAGELIARIFSGVSWDSIPIIGNWHMELDDRYNWRNLWKPDPDCDTSECDTCGSLQPTCWRTKVFEADDPALDVAFEWDTTMNHTPETLFTDFTPRASLKVHAIDACKAGWWFKCVEPTAVAPGVSYTCSAWVRHDGGMDTLWLGIRWFDESGFKISDSLSLPFTEVEPDTWVPISHTWSSPSGDGQDAYSCFVSCIVAADTGVVWFDDVQLYEGLRWKTYWPDTAFADTGTIVWGCMDSLEADDGKYLTIQAEWTGSSWKTDWYGQVTIDEGRDAVRRLWVGYDGHYTTGNVEHPKVQYICLWNWTFPGWWDTLCATSDDSSCWNLIRRADITHGWSTANADSIQDYIDSDGDIQLRIVTEDASAIYNCLADYMRFSVEYVPQQQ